MAEKSTGTLVTIDIGSGTVAVRFRTGATTTTRRVSFQASPEAEFPEFLTAITHTLTKALNEVQKEHGAMKHPITTAVSIGAPWYVVKVKNTIIEENRGTRFDGAKVAALIQKASKAFLEAGVGELGDDAVIIERDPLAIIENGYPVIRPITATVTDATVSLAITASSKAFVEGVRQAIDRSFASQTFHMATRLKTSWEAIRNTPLYGHSLLCIEAGSEVTTIALSVEGLLSHVNIVPVGMRSVGGTLNQKTTPAAWQKAVTSVFHEFSCEYLLPPYVLVSAHPEVLKNAMEALEGVLSKEPFAFTPQVLSLAETLGVPEGEDRWITLLERLVHSDVRGR